MDSCQAVTAGRILAWHCRQSHSRPRIHHIKWLTNQSAWARHNVQMRLAFVHLATHAANRVQMLTLLCIRGSCHPIRHFSASRGHCSGGRMNVICTCGCLCNRCRDWCSVLLLVYIVLLLLVLYEPIRKCPLPFLYTFKQKVIRLKKLPNTRTRSLNPTRFLNYRQSII